MTCNNMIPTYRLDGSPAKRPCGSCLDCRLTYARQWAVRCIHESMMHKENCFITLTYNQENLPPDRSVHKSDIQKFMKRLRRQIEPKKVRYFGCGEYGSKFSRPHYHLCLFGHNFSDKEIRKAGLKRRFRNTFKTGHDHDLFTSQRLEEVWQKGFCTIGELTFESAGYTARYVTKKVTGEKKDAHYGVYAPGKRNPEFAVMSRRPGIGKPWIDKYMSDVYPKDYSTVRGHKQKPPRYYDTYYAKEHPKAWEKLKTKRRIYADNQPFETSLRGHQKDVYRQQITKTLERKIE